MALEELLPEDLNDPFHSLAVQCGIEVVILLSQQCGGITLYIPERRFETGHRVARAIGDESAEVLRRICVRQCELYKAIPTLRELEGLVQRRKIRAALSAGQESISEIANRFGVSRQTVMYQRRKLRPIE